MSASVVPTWSWTLVDRWYEIMLEHLFRSELHKVSNVKKLLNQNHPLVIAIRWVYLAFSYI